MKTSNEQSDRPAADGFLPLKRLGILSPSVIVTSIIKIKQTLHQVPGSIKKKQLNISLKMCILFAR